MNRMLRMACVAAAGVLLLACAEEKEASYLENERLALHAWMKINRPKLLENYQEQGGYYVDVLSEGVTDATPISGVASWLRFTFTGRNLGGDIVLTRNESEARQLGTFTSSTYYAPYFRYYAGDNNSSLIEGTYLAMHNTLMLGETYASANNLPRRLQMRYGTKVTLYMPSSVVSSSGVSGSGGYEGQGGYELKTGSPFVVTMEIVDTVRNPVQREGANVDRFAKDNGGLKPLPKTTLNAALRDVVPPPYDPENPYNDGFGWRNANKDIPQVYVNLIYAPTTKYKFPTTYSSSYTYSPYVNFNELEQTICDTLVNRFGPYEGPMKLDTVTVRKNGTAKIWYIGRFLDGFIFDSNIPGVRRLIYGETSTQGKALSYNPEKGGMIEAFFYAIPNLRYGQWAGILTTSLNAYGASGKSGVAATSSGYDNLSYYDMQNNLYGMNGLMPDYYNLMYGGLIPSENTSATKINTEIPPFQPLLFQIYIEPKE